MRARNGDSTARLKEWMGADLSGLDIMGVQIDGIHISISCWPRHLSAAPAGGSPRIPPGRECVLW
jgi:hypothetical protein